MRSVVQRVKRASVKVKGETVGEISAGLLVLLGVGLKDGESDIAWMVDKLGGLRIFEDKAGKMNCSLQDSGGEILLVSQFTLYGDCRSGKRPSFTAASPPDRARVLFEQTAEGLRSKGFIVKTGIFQAEMDVELINDGPVTILLDSEKTF
ncbi:D-tyrosyl-tRNA(Tyr) deacylase [Desulfosporosinus acidiphilus SJ4]|uniref:D-aminoacyl-tRNA deacylase n=1 Tax=Desulfosporosinus acidiphilus (strain DSM 22704 / JCM 16185 / SJ4) TaxID=646529 RepID=I4D983_DESAJ|nr:D-aminoacyl-tRNA deacylase [Desulfosporosinus acidiphilus]AFM42357.1 D-tyrosyl-tRNA(Tyr) deacylase [Desulfosporosinus acidiphilus SJ4]